MAAPLVWHRQDKIRITVCRYCNTPKNRHYYDKPGDRICTDCRSKCGICRGPKTGSNQYQCNRCIAGYQRARYAERHPHAEQRTGHSVDFYTLWAWLDTQIGRPLPYLKDVAVLTCTKYQTTWARRHKNRIPVESARRIATHFGVTPTDIWTDWPKGYEQ